MCSIVAMDRDRKKNKRAVKKYFKKKRKKYDKGTSQQIHAFKRMKERYGIKYTPEVRRVFISQILEKRVKLLGRQSSRVSVYECYYKGLPYPVVWDRVTNEVVTILPKEALTQNFEGE